MLPSLAKAANPVPVAILRSKRHSSASDSATNAAMVGVPQQAHASVAFLEDPRLPGLVPGEVDDLKEEPVFLEVVPTLGMRRRSSVAEAISRDPAALEKLCIEVPLTPRSVKNRRVSTMSTMASLSTMSSLSIPATPASSVDAWSARASEISSLGSSRASTAFPMPPKDVRFDVCTLRFWFDSIDENGSGTIDKEEWMKFMRENPHIDRMINRGEVEPEYRKKKDSYEGFLQGKDDAAQIKRRMLAWRTIDKDRTGTLDWEEFIAYFRRCGNFLELKPASPKYRIYELVRAMREEPESVTENDMVELKSLVVKHLSASQRSCMSPEVRQRLSLPSPAWYEH